MVLETIYLDALRAAHLTFFAAGMGTGLFHDYMTFRTLADPISKSEIASIDRLHGWIRFAFAGLWITGLALIYVRTSFDIAAFSPKLWTKVTLMAAMSVNAVMIGFYILPMLRKNIGKSMFEIPLRDLRAATQIAIISMFGWSSGMILGSSTYLKTAPWEVLIPAAVGWFILCTVGGQMAIGFLRARALERDAQDDQLAFDLG